VTGRWTDQPPGARCYICELAPAHGALMPFTEPCERPGHMSEQHTWWICSAACAYHLGRRAGLGSLEFEAATHPVEVPRAE
jgi:hypothetical protein